MWIPGFEQSLFLHDIDDLRGVGSVYYDELPWLDVASDATGLPPIRGGAPYHLCFLGRESNYYGAYGHFGVAHTGVLLEKVEMIEQIPVPKDFKFDLPGAAN